MTIKDLKEFLSGFAEPMPIDAYDGMKAKQLLDKLEKVDPTIEVFSLKDIWEIISKGE